MLRLVQFRDESGEMRVAACNDEGAAHVVRGVATTYDDPTAVVDSELRVRGIEGLRVIDCSIMPQIVSGNTNAPAMAIGSKAASLVAGAEPT